MRLKLISCEVFTREFCSALTRSPHEIDLQFLPKGLHDIGCADMCERLQAAIDAVNERRYDAILLGYGMCSGGVVGLSARAIPLVVPRAHDCMTLFFGSLKRYEQFFQDNPGTYFLTSGWIERSEPDAELRQLSILHNNGMDLTLQQFIDKYGDDNGRYLFDQLGDQTRHYRQLTFLAMGVEPDARFEEHAARRAAEKGWRFTVEMGNLRLITALVNGTWDDREFLTVPCGRTICATSDGSLIAAGEPARE